MHIEKGTAHSAEEYWTVRVDPNELRMASGKTLPYGTWIGRITAKGNVKVWTPAASKPHGYKDAAKSLLLRAKEQLQREGKVRSPRAKSTYRRDGSFIVKTATGRGRGKTSSFNEMSHAQQWATAQLEKAPNGSKAAFFRRSESGAKGYPYTEPFQLFEKNEYGHIRMGSPRDWK